MAVVVVVVVPSWEGHHREDDNNETVEQAKTQTPLPPPLSLSLY
jgi:hypothetical protein